MDKIAIRLNKIYPNCNPNVNLVCIGECAQDIYPHLKKTFDDDTDIIISALNAFKDMNEFRTTCSFFPKNTLWSNEILLLASGYTPEEVIEDYLFYEYASTADDIISKYLPQFCGLEIPLNEFIKKVSETYRIDKKDVLDRYYQLFTKDNMSDGSKDIRTALIKELEYFPPTDTSLNRDERSQGYVLLTMSPWEKGELYWKLKS